MCVAPLERWPKVSFTYASMPSEGFRGVCVVAGEGSMFHGTEKGVRSVLRCHMLCLCPFRWCLGHADAARAVVDSRSSPRLVGKDGL